MKADLFQSCGHCCVFQICWHIACSTFTASSLGFEIAQLEFYHLHYLCSQQYFLSPTGLCIIGCMALGEWSQHHDYLSHEDLFCIVFCVFLSPLLNIFCFCQVHTISVLYWAHLCMKCSLGISNFLEEISSLSHSIVFLYFFALITEEGFLISPCYSLELCTKWVYLSFSPLPLASILFTAICKASSDNDFAFLHFFFLGPAADCHRVRGSGCSKPG